MAELLKNSPVIKAVATVSIIFMFFPSNSMQLAKQKFVQM